LIFIIVIVFALCEGKNDNIEMEGTMLPQAISTFEWPPRKSCN